MQHSRLEYSTPSGRVLALHVRSTNMTTRTSPPCFYLIVLSIYYTVYYILKKQEIATSEEMVAYLAKELSS